MKCRISGCPNDVAEGFSCCSQQHTVQWAAIQAQPFDPNPPPKGPRKPPERRNPLGPDWLWPDELAKAIGTNVWNVLDWRRKGKIPCHQLGPRRFLFNLAAVKEAISNQSERQMNDGDAPHFKQVKVTVDRGSKDMTAAQLWEGNRLLVEVLIEDADAAEERGELDVAYRLLKALVRGTVRRENADRRNQGEELSGYPGPGAEAGAGEPDRRAEQSRQNGGLEGAGIRGEGIV